MGHRSRPCMSGWHGERSQVWVFWRKFLQGSLQALNWGLKCIVLLCFVFSGTLPAQPMTVVEADGDSISHEPTNQAAVPELKQPLGQQDGSVGKRAC